jgi:drug/metabolite transporter (DMT)-like permease
MIMAALFLKEPVTGKKAGGVLLGLGGALLLVFFGNGRNAGGSSNVWGDLLCLLSQISYAVYLVFFQDVIKKYSPVTLMKWKYTFGALILLPLVFSSLFSVEWASLPSDQLGGLAYILFFGTFLSYMIVPIGQKHLRPTVVAMYNYLQPVTAAAVAILWGLESFSIVKLIAVILIFSGVLLVNRSRAAEKN